MAKVPALLLIVAPRTGVITGGNGLAPDLEPVLLRQGSGVLVTFDLANVASELSFDDCFQKGFHFSGNSACLHFHSAVREIFYSPDNFVPGGNLLDHVPEAYTLDFSRVKNLEVSRWKHFEAGW